MKMKGAKAVHYDSGPNMTPLVDVVMVILIFLMLTGSFGALSHFMPSTMPIKTSGKGAMDPTKIPKVPDPQLDIRVMNLGDHYAAVVGDKKCETYDQLLEVLKQKRQAHEASGSTADKMQVMIAPRLSTKYEHIMSVYQAAMEAQWPKIGFQSAKD